MKVLKKALPLLKGDRVFAMSVRSETRTPQRCHCSCNK